jgi:adenylate cyclase
VAVEIEREDRYLVSPALFKSWRKAHIVSPQKIIQNYISMPGDSLVMRVRNFSYHEGSEMYTKTIKKSIGKDTSKEFERKISKEEYEELLQLSCGRVVVKKRYCMQGWDVDVFQGSNAGLIIAEYEYKEGEPKVQLPPWISEENNITGNREYSNLALAFKE